MPLSDLFRKSKKEPASAPQNGPSKSAMTDDSLFSSEMQKKRYDAAMEFLKVFQEKIPLLGGKPHAGTVVSIAARLAGTSLYRSINKRDFVPGMIVLSEEVNQAYPQLLNLFAFYCKQNGIDVLAKPVVTKFPEKDKPRMDVAQVQAEYQDQYDEIMQRHGLDYMNGARAGMVVCSMVFQYHCTVARDIDPYVATGIIAMGVVEGAKTAPPPLESGGRAAGITRDRLVLGERDAAIQEALDHGGTFLDIGDDLERSMQEKGIDPYLVYEQAMIMNIEKKISRIDFVKADVNKLLDEWQSQAEVPIHVRLILWLKNNAAAYGYEQSGNSWILSQ